MIFGHSQKDKAMAACEAFFKRKRFSLFWFIMITRLIMCKFSQLLLLTYTTAFRRLQNLLNSTFLKQYSAQHVQYYVFGRFLFKKKWICLVYREFIPLFSIIPINCDCMPVSHEYYLNITFFSL